MSSGAMCYAWKTVTLASSKNPPRKWDKSRTVIVLWRTSTIRITRCGFIQSLNTVSTEMTLNPVVHR